MAWYDFTAPPISEVANDLIAELENTLEALQQYVAYGEEMRSIGRGFYSTDKFGCPPEHTIAAARDTIVKAKAALR